MRCGELGEPLIDAFLDDVIENGHSALVGCKVLPKNGYANGCVPGTDVSENVIEVTALVQFGGGTDVID